MKKGHPSWKGCPSCCIWYDSLEVCARSWLCTACPVLFLVFLGSGCLESCRPFLGFGLLALDPDELPPLVVSEVVDLAPGPDADLYVVLHLQGLASCVDPADPCDRLEGALFIVCYFHVLILVIVKK